MARTPSPSFTRVLAALIVVSSVALLSLPAAAAPTFTILHAFTGTGSDGSFPQGGLLEDHNLNLFGETQLGGTGGVGTNYTVTNTGSSFATTYNFGATPTDGQVPTGGLLNAGFDFENDHSNDFGVAQAGGANSFGTVFVSDHSGHEATLHDFAGPDGQTPVGRLQLGLDGNYYGTTLTGGGAASADSGVVFRVSPSGSFKVLHLFTGPDGAGPNGGLQFGSDAKFYGTTGGGGTFGAGVVYRITPGGLFKVIYNFTGGNDGSAPVGELESDFSGNLYGVTSGGGAGGAGTIFKVTQSGVFTLLYTFSPDINGNFPNGANPAAGLTLGNEDSDSQIVQLGAKAVLIRRLSARPLSIRPMFGSSGDNRTILYGTTQLGGNANNGVVFSFNLLTNAYTLLYVFSGPDGSQPAGKLLVSFDGNIYGTATTGGPGSNGVVFALGGVITPSFVRPSFHIRTIH